jgi:hypothetical protein
MKGKFTPEEQAKLAEFDAALAAMPTDGVGAPYSEHFRLIREAIAAYDVVGTLTEIRNLLNHVLSDEGMHSGVGAVPWLALITMAFELFKLFVKR